MGYFIHEESAASVQARQFTDARGLAVSTRSDSAARHVETALEAMLSYFGDPLAALDAAAAEDPSWAFPHTLKAGLLLTMTEYAATARAAEVLHASASLAARGNERERAHAAAAQAAASGDWESACDAWESILVRWPLDVAALLFAHLFDFYRGDALNLKRRPQRVLPHWSASLPLYGYVLGMHAFGLEECGHYDQAEDAGRAALEANPRDPWAVHAVTHVFEMQGRHRDGARWLQARHRDWAIDNGLAFHNWFHAALFQIENMDTAAALATFDAHLANATDMALQRVDGTAVLWRLKLLGVDVASRFDALRRTWESQAPDAGFYAFNDVHALIAHVGAADAGALEAAGAAILASLATPASGGPTNRRMSAEVGLPVAHAFQHYAQGRWAAAVQGLLAVRDRAHGFGGSHAQRDLLSLTLLDAAVRAGDKALATHLLNERIPAKASTPLTAYWRHRIG